MDLVHSQWSGVAIRPVKLKTIKTFSMLQSLRINKTNHVYKVTIEAYPNDGN